MKSKILTNETIRHLGVTERSFPLPEVGDHVAVHQWITEGSKKRIQIFQGDVIGLSKNGASTTFRVRKLADGGIYVERIYPYYSPIIEKVAFIRKGDVRRAKLYYLRGRIGKTAKVAEKIMTKEAKARAAKKVLARSEAAAVKKTQAKASTSTDEKTEK